MILRWFTLTLFAIVFAPGLLNAQQQPLHSEPQQSQNSTAIMLALMAAKPQPNYEKMYEDIEIMRRILDGKLDSLYPSAMRQRNSTRSELWYWEPSTYEADVTVPGEVKRTNTLRVVPETRYVQPIDGVPFKALEGVYLKGHGVVYTARMPSLEPPAKAEANSTAKLLTWTIAHPESGWDTIRRQVRNEKEEPKKPEWSKPPSLSDVLLKMLAENGHHFSQLGENESLTIVLTVHESCPSLPAGNSGTGGSAQTASEALALRARDALAQKEADDLALLGAMHLKQAKYGEAISAYEKLLKRANTPKQEAEVRRKLAQCYLGMGEDEKAQTELNKAIALLKKEKEAKEKLAAKPVAALPVKLIISAPKKLLDQVKAGKITFEEFRRQASVETLRFDDHR